MAIVLSDAASYQKLYPLTFTRAVADIRMGILTRKHWWQRVSGQQVFVATQPYLQPLYEVIPPGDHIYIDASVLPNQHLLKNILAIEQEAALFDNKGIIAARKFFNSATDFSQLSLQQFNVVKEVADAKRLEYPWQIFQWNDEMIRQQFALITKGKISQPISVTNRFIQPENIFIEEGAQVEFALLNASTGPIYIGKNAVVMEGAFIRGPFVLLEGAVVKMGTKIYGDTTIGPCATVGGELKNVVIQGYSNKAHDGYLGDSVIGEWCNLGAGTSNSNVKNTGSDVLVWDAHSRSLVNAGAKCGLVMGDYTRAAINTSINTGSVFGVCCNIFGEGLTPKLLQNFTWGSKGLTRYELEKALKDIDQWKKFKQHQLSEAEAAVLKHIFEQLST